MFHSSQNLTKSLKIYFEIHTYKILIWGNSVFFLGRENVRVHLEPVFICCSSIDTHISSDTKRVNARLVMAHPLNFNDVKILIKIYLCMSIFEVSNHYNDWKYWYDLYIDLCFLLYTKVLRWRKQCFSYKKYICIRYPIPT